MKKRRVIREVPKGKRPWLIATNLPDKLHTCDSPERIAACLNCQRETCVNCFGPGRGKQ